MTFPLTPANFSSEVLPTEPRGSDPVAYHRVYMYQTPLIDYQVACGPQGLLFRIGQGEWSLRPSSHYHAEILLFFHLSQPAPGKRAKERSNGSRH